VPEIYIQLPLPEFERLHDEIKRLNELCDAYVNLANTINQEKQRHVARVAELENELLKAYSERDAAVVELNGLRWGLSNANAEEQALREWGPDD